MLVFLFTVQARLLEIFYVPGLAMILALLALSGGVMGGDVMGAARSRVGIFLIAFRTCGQGELAGHSGLDYLQPQGG